jgi:hypothetical protein
MWQPSDIDDVVGHLLRSMKNRSLSIFCGAGLSMGDPSNLPSAGNLINDLKEAYFLDTGSSLADQVSDTTKDLGIEDIAAWAFENAPEFQNFFLKTIRAKYSKPFSHPPNAGHRAVADFLLTQAVRATVSTNVDRLIEEAAEELGQYDFRAAVEAGHTQRTPSYSMLLKLHGCFDREEQYTVWCEEQLKENRIQSRIEAFQNWIEVAGGKDVLIIGYWSDWPHINETFAEVVKDVHPRSVTVVNPNSPAGLKEKAEELWKWVGTENINFRYVPCDGNTFMTRLRRAFSERFFRHLFHDAQQKGWVKEYYRFEASGEANMPRFEDMDMASIYAMRRDFAGVPSGDPVTDALPNHTHYEQIGALHELLLEKSASMNGRFYQVHDDVIRLINARRQPFSRVQRKFEGGGDALRGVDVNVCVGPGEYTPGKPNHVRGSTAEDDVVRTGDAQEWWTDDDLVERLDDLDAPSDPEHSDASSS